MQKIQFVSYKQTKSWSKQSWGEDHDNKWKTEDRNQVFNQSRDEDDLEGGGEAKDEDMVKMKTGAEIETKYSIKGKEGNWQWRC